MGTRLLLVRFEVDLWELHAKSPVIDKNVYSLLQW